MLYVPSLVCLKVLVESIPWPGFENTALCSSESYRGKNGSKVRSAFPHVTVVVGNVPVSRKQTVLIAWHRPFLRAHTRFVLSEVEQTAQQSSLPCSQISCC